MKDVKGNLRIHSQEYKHRGLAHQSVILIAASPLTPEFNTESSQSTATCSIPPNTSSFHITQLTCHLQLYQLSTFLLPGHCPHFQLCQLYPLLFTNPFYPRLTALLSTFKHFILSYLEPLKCPSVSISPSCWTCCHLSHLFEYLYHQC